MPANEQRPRTLSSGDPFLTFGVEPHGPPCQEIVITGTGDLEIPWMVPSATDLVTALWGELSREPFPVDANGQRIYCG